MILIPRLTVAEGLISVGRTAAPECPAKGLEGDKAGEEDFSLLSSDLCHIRHLHDPNSEAAKLGVAGLPRGVVNIVHGERDVKSKGQVDRTMAILASFSRAATCRVE